MKQERCQSIQAKLQSAQLKTTKTYKPWSPRIAVWLCLLRSSYTHLKSHEKSADFKIG